MAADVWLCKGADHEIVGEEMVGCVGGALLGSMVRASGEGLGP